MEPSSPLPPSGRKGSNPDPSSQRQPRRGIARLHRPAYAVVLAIGLSLSACAMEHSSQFDADAWKSQRGVAPQENSRGAMVPALEKVLHAGMHRDEVVELLGEPDFSDTSIATETYELGLAGSGVDEEYYEIRYRDGKLASHRMGRR